MSNTASAEGAPRLCGRALCTIVLALGLSPVGAYAQPRDISFNGELSYTAFRAAASRGQTVTIRYSPGGTGAAALALARVSKVVVDGACNSACAWSFVRNANACFTPRARFGFHAAHDPGTGRRLNAATSYWLQGVRPSLKGKLGALLGTSSLIKVSAAEMRRHYGDRVCGAEPRTEIASLEANKRISKTARTAKTKSDVGKVDVVGTEVAVETTLLSPRTELAAAIALLPSRDEAEGLVTEAVGALPALFSAAQFVEAGADWKGQDRLLFATVTPGTVTTAQRPIEEKARPTSLSLLYRGGITFA